MLTVLVTDLPDPLVGRIIDAKYRILEPLGEGGMAQVYTAEHLVLEHPVAIKFLRRELAIDAEFAERFAREAKTIAQLNSEHIVKVLDVGHLEGAGPYMVMEYLDGEDLQTRLGRHGPLPLAEAIGYVIQALSMVPFAIAIVRSLRQPATAGADPWHANSLEWSTTSPPPHHNFVWLPPIRSERPTFDYRWINDPDVSAVGPNDVWRGRRDHEVEAPSP